MDLERATTLVQRALTDPIETHREAAAALGAATTPVIHAMLLRCLGLCAREVETLDASAEYLRSSAQIATQAGRDDLVADALFSLSGTLALAGSTDAALAALADAERRAPEAMHARIEFQRASIVAREGRLDEARAAYDRALARFQAAGDDFYIAAALSNRGMVRLEQGDLVGARADLTEATQRQAAKGNTQSAAFGEHNLGRVAGRAGDVVEALARFRAAEQTLRRHGVDVGEVQVNRAEVLLGAGLYGEAEVVAAAAAASTAKSHFALDQAEALYAQSMALVGQGKRSAAVSTATQAAALFREQGRPGWAARADLLALQGADEWTADDAARVAGELESHGQWVAAMHAWTVVSERDPERATTALAAVPAAYATATLEQRLSRLLVRARAGMARGDYGAAARATQAALGQGAAQRALVGAVDLRAAVSAQLAHVATFGLRLRRDHGTPWDVLRWVDRFRNVATSGRIVGQRHPETEGILGELRAVQHQARDASPEAMPELLRRQGALQRQLVASHRIHLTGRAAEPIGVPRRDLLRGVTVIHHHWNDGRLGAVVVEGGRSRLVDLGEQPDVVARRTHVARAAKRVAAGEAAALAQLRRHADALAALTVPPISGARPVVIVPPPDLAAVPWALLPGLDHVAVTIAPSLGHWQRSAAPGPGRPGTAVIGIVASSALPTASAECAAVGAAWPGHEVRVSWPSAVGEATALLEQVDVLHVLCHGDRRQRDGRFATLVLDDGDLMSIDLETVARAPELVVLAACEAGLLDALPGDETAGLASALFAAGTSTVMAPVAVIADAPATTLMFAAVHRAIAAGMAPEQALFEMQQAQEDPVGRACAQLVNCYGGTGLRTTR